MKEAKQASVAVFERDGLYLTVSRRDRDDQWGLPGGKVDANETSVEAICREVDEEVGVMSSMMWWVPIAVTADPPFWVTAYLWVEEPIRDDELVAEEGLLIKWMTRDQLCDPQVSPFSDFNVNMFNALDQYRKLTNG